MKILTQFMVIITLCTGVVSCKKTTQDVQSNVNNRQEDLQAVAGMNNAYSNMVIYHDSFSHPLNPHHKQKHDSLYHHNDSLYNHHHKVYHHADTSHHNNGHHTITHHNRHDSLNIFHHKLH